MSKHIYTYIKVSNIPTVHTFQLISLNGLDSPETSLLMGFFFKAPVTYLKFVYLLQSSLALTFYLVSPFCVTEFENNIFRWGGLIEIEINPNLKQVNTFKLIAGRGR